MQSSQQRDQDPLTSEKRNSELNFKREKPSGSLEKPLVSPFLAHSLGSIDFVFASYCQRHNMVIALCSYCILKFYDAATFLPIEARQSHKLDDFVTAMSYNDETDTFVLGCRSESLDAYNAQIDELRLLRKHEKMIRTITFMNSAFCAFSMLDSCELAIGALDNETVCKFELGSGPIISLYQMPQENFLFLGLNNGCVRVLNNTKRVPRLQTLSLIRAHQAGKMVTAIQSVVINGKEHVVTTSEDRSVKIWCWIKGRWRLLRVIQTKRAVDSFVYLENYRMVAVACEGFNEIGFFKLPSEKLETTFCCEFDAKGLFMMKDKNMIGFLNDMGLFGNSIEFVQLHPKEN